MIINVYSRVFHAYRESTSIISNNYKVVLWPLNYKQQKSDDHLLVTLSLIVNISPILITIKN